MVSFPRLRDPFKTSGEEGPAGTGTSVSVRAFGGIVQGAIAVARSAAGPRSVPPARCTPYAACGPGDAVDSGGANSQGPSCAQECRRLVVRLQIRRREGLY